MTQPSHLSRHYASRAGSGRSERCTTCAHFRPGPEGDRVRQCTNPEAPLYRASENMHYASACRLFEARDRA